MEEMMLVGVDTGGTFTDIVVMQTVSGTLRLRHCKVLSDPTDPSGPIEQGLRKLGLGNEGIQVIHGTTVGTNAVLEGKGARVAYITSKGFADVLTLGRQERQQVYSLHQQEVDPPVPAGRCFEINTRILSDGNLLERAGDDEIEDLVQALHARDVESIAINLLFSFLRPDEERRIARQLEKDWFTSCSSEVFPGVREFERGIATWLNASVGPVISRYLERLGKRLLGSRVAVMQSSGTTISADQAAAKAVHLLLSGPAGGLAATRSIAKQTGNPKLMSFDMGGTSTDVALYNGKIPLTGSSRLGAWPLPIPSVDIHTIGAGGGSIARVDKAGMLLVGPESAGADPGPACYARGGNMATVTDANLVLGRIPESTLLGGYLPLDADAARSTLSELAVEMGCDVLEAAHGVIRIANEHMARALRVISVERGHDPAEYTLVCFGGAGGLHACDLAELLGMDRIVVPVNAGVLSAMGMLVSEPGRELSQAVLAPLASLDDDEILQRFRVMESDACEQLLGEGCDLDAIRFKHQLELRYQGQSATIGIGWKTGQAHAERFHEEHARISGQRLRQEVELVNLRLGARAPSALQSIDIPHQVSGSGEAAMHRMPGFDEGVPVRAREGVPCGEAIGGPCILTEAVATTWIKPGWTVMPDEWGNLCIEYQT